MAGRLFAVAVAFAVATTAQAQWSQFGGNQRHTGNAAVSAQPMARVLADVIHDPLVPFEIDPNSGDLFVHYAAPLLDGDDVFMSFKGMQPSSGATVWSVHRLHWENGQLVDKWSAVTDWQPVPATSGLWEPAFQSVLTNDFLYAPAEGGTLLQINRNTGSIVKRINPFTTIDPLTFVSGPPAADASGNIFYGVFRMQSGQPWLTDVTGAWLVRVTPEGATSLVSFSTLVPDAPKAGDLCKGQFSSNAQVPPSPNAVPLSIPCGSQRPGVNVTPAIGPDGTIYVLSRTHFDSYYSYLVAVNPNMTPKWDRSLRTRFHDGCNILLPPNGTPGGCPLGTATGVDPYVNEDGSGRVIDNSTASPVVAPDGSIIYGSYTLYNEDQGHLMHFGADGTYLSSYSFGWDTTPAIWQHDGTYSIVTKENHYPFSFRTDLGDFVTQLDPQFNVEWQYRNPSRTSCRDGCVTEAAGFEWCVNAPAIDMHGTVYMNAEDGIIYAIGQGGVLLDRLTLGGPLGAACTPLAIDAQGRVYAQTGGHLFAVGGVFSRRRAVR